MIHLFPENGSFISGKWFIYFRKNDSCILESDLGPSHDESFYNGLADDRTIYSGNGSFISGKIIHLFPGNDCFISGNDSFILTHLF